MQRIYVIIGQAAYYVSWPLLYVYLRFSKRTRVVILNDKGDVLLLKPWLGSGRWILPGGGVHRNEHVVNAALREVKEETGLSLNKSSLQSLGRYHNKKGFRYEYHGFIAELEGEEELKKQRLEVCDLRWMPLKSLKYNQMSYDTWKLVRLASDQP